MNTWKVEPESQIQLRPKSLLEITNTGHFTEKSNPLEIAR